MLTSGPGKLRKQQQQQQQSRHGQLSLSESPALLTSHVSSDTSPRPIQRKPVATTPENGYLPSYNPTHHRHEPTYGETNELFFPSEQSQVQPRPQEHQDQRQQQHRHLQAHSPRPRSASYLSHFERLPLPAQQFQQQQAEQRYEQQQQTGQRDYFPVQHPPPIETNYSLYQQRQPSYYHHHHSQSEDSGNMLSFRRPMPVPPPQGPPPSVPQLTETAATPRTPQAPVSLDAGASSRARSSSFNANAAAAAAGATSDHNKVRKAPSPDNRGRRSSSAQPGVRAGGTGGAGARGRSAGAGPRVPSHPPPAVPAVPSLPVPAAGVVPRKSGSNSPSRIGGDKEKERGRLRRSWLPGSTRSRSASHGAGGGPRAAYAWVLSPDNQGQYEYNTAYLANGERVPELWDDGSSPNSVAAQNSGFVSVYLYPRTSARGPTFRVSAHVLAASLVFYDLIQADMSQASPTDSAGGSTRNGQDHLSPPGSPPLGSDAQRGASDAHETRLFIADACAMVRSMRPGMPDAPNLDVDRLVSLRNLFAFLTGQPLVATKTRPTLFLAFLEVAALLREFEFTNYDGSSFGDAADLSFGFYRDQLQLEDVRTSREKTLEAVILGEQMRCWDLYNEAFTHMVGKYTAIVDLKSPLFNSVSQATRQRVERAHFDLLGRQSTANDKLESFEFPSLFAGIANSTSFDEYKNVRFSKWRTAFGRVRGFVLSYYKSRLGNWPPKASSKKNSFSESGLNRQVLKLLYSDLCALYDLLADRQSLTPRVVDKPLEEVAEEEPEEGEEAGDPNVAALRILLDEFDRSSPPVLPAIPFDTPRLPTPASISERYDNLTAKEQTKFDKHIRENELLLILHKAYNLDTDFLKVPFLAEFKEFEHKEARGKTAADLVDNRIGYWIFLYVVLQSLPMLVVDAPNLRHADGVEYFLCEPPMGNPPWVSTERVGGVRKVWYEISGGAGGIVELSADAVMFSVEATYHRSHCWLAAKIWEQANAPPPPAAAEASGALLEPPRNGSVPDPADATSDHRTSTSSGETYSDGATLASVASSATTVSAARPSSMASLASGSPVAVAPQHQHQHQQPLTTAELQAQARVQKPGALARGPVDPSYRSSIFIGLAPLANPAADHRASRVISGSFAGGPPAVGGGGGSIHSHHSSTSSFGGGVGGAGGGSLSRPGRPGGMPRSISMGNLKSAYAAADAPPTPPLPVGQGPAQQQHPLQQQVSPPATPGAQGQAQGGFTFDNILKDLDNQKKKKKKTFFGAI